MTDTALPGSPRPAGTPAFVHPTAEVEEGVVLGPGCTVWHHAHVRSGAVLGDGVSLGKNVFVDAGVQIGAGARIQNNVSVYQGVRLEEQVFVGPSVVFTNDRYPRVGGRWDTVGTLVRRGASIGANATIVAGCEIGEWAMVAAGAVVTRDVVSRQLVLGNPARPGGWVCLCGHVLTRRPALPVPEPCPGCRTDTEPWR